MVKAARPKQKQYKSSTRDSFVPSGWKPSGPEAYPRIRGWGGTMYGGIAFQAAQALLDATPADVRGTVEVYPFLDKEDKAQERIGCHVFTNLFVGTSAREVSYQHAISYDASEPLWNYDIPGAEVAAWQGRASSIAEPAVEEELAALGITEEYVAIPEMEGDYLDDDPWALDPA